jgi:hypothetical protein
LGKAIAIGYAHEGAITVIIDISLNVLEKVASKLLA